MIARIDRGLLLRIGGSALALAGLLSAAIWNGYPIVYSDTSSYLISGFHLETLIDRPITYGLFIRLCSLNGSSLWPVVITQSLLLAHVLGLILRSAGIANALLRGACIAGVALTTGLPFVTGQILTDVFTPILIATVVLLLGTEKRTGRQMLKLYGIFLMSFAMHMSHVAITALLLLIAVLVRLLWTARPSGILHWGTMVSISLLAVVGTLAMGVAIAKSRNSFFAARMADSGILQAYLEEHCQTGSFKLCQRKGNIPQDANAFLWDDDTPMNVFSSRREMDDELGRITKGTFTEPRFIAMHVSAAASATVRQLNRFNAGDGNGPFREGTKLHERIALFIPSEIPAFDSARQMSETRFQGPLVRANKLYWLTFWLSCLGLLLLMVYLAGKRHLLSLDLRFAVVLLTASVLINATVNSSLVMVADRFGTKMAWMTSFCALLVAVVTFRRRTPLGS